MTKAKELCSDWNMKTFFKVVHDDMEKCMDHLDDLRLPSEFKASEKRISNEKRDGGKSSGVRLSCIRKYNASKPEGNGVFSRCCLSSFLYITTGFVLEIFFSSASSAACTLFT